MIQKVTLKKILEFFSSFNYKKLMILIFNPIILMYNNYYYLFLALLIISLVDLRFGIKVYAKQNKKKFKYKSPSTWGIIKSEGIRKTFKKLKDYFYIILAVFCIEQYMFKGTDATILGYTITHICFLILAGIEAWSIGENFKKLRGYNLFEYLLNFLLKRDIKETLKEIQDEESDNKNS